MGVGNFYTYDINDPKDRIEDIAAAAVETPNKHLINAHEFAKELQQYHWDNRRITNHGVYTGMKEYQWLAHIPGKVAELLDRRHPGWCDSEEALKEVLAKYPECRVQPDIRRKG